MGQTSSYEPLTRWIVAPRRTIEALRRRALVRGDGEAALELARRALLDRCDLVAARRWVHRAAVLDEEDAGFYASWLEAKARWRRTHRHTRRRGPAGDFARGIHELGRPARSRNPRRGIEWLRAAARGGHPEADLALGFAFALGEGRRFWIGAALDAFRSAARGGAPLAMACYGHVLLETEGAEVSEARTWLRRGAAHVPWAALELAMFLVRRRSEDNHWTRVAAEGGIPQAQNLWGETLRDGPTWGVRRDLREAVVWLRRAADQGHSFAQLSLGCLLHEGRGVGRDDRAALLWYRRSAKRGNVLAMKNLALCYRHGDGVRQDEERARSWERRAAARAREL